MKINRIILIIALCLVVVFAAILLKRSHLPVTPVVTNNTSNSLTPVNSQTKLVTSNEVSGKANVTGEEGYSQKVIDPKTGQCAFVSLNERIITLKDRNNNVIWTMNLDKEASLVGLPTGKIDGVTFIEKPQWLYVGAGKISLTIDMHTGKITGSAMH